MKKGNIAPKTTPPIAAGGSELDSRTRMSEMSSIKTTAQLEDTTSEPKMRIPVVNTIDDAQRRSYLNSRGLKYGEQMALGLVFPDMQTREDLRHMPNEYARSSMFTVRNKKEKRKIFLQERLFHYNEHVSILYTGMELRADDDELVWLEIMKYAANVALGEPFEFNLLDLMRGLDWPRNGRNYTRIRQSLSRMKATEVQAINTKAYGKSGAISLIKHYISVNDNKGNPTEYRVWIDPDLIVMFAGGTYTNVKWDIYRKLSPVARRLADYLESHKNPYPISAEKFRLICGSTNMNSRSWLQQVKNACSELEAAKIVTLAKLDKKNQICCVR